MRKVVALGVGMTKFSGKFTASVPNRLGPAPGGFVYTTGSMKAVLL